MTMDATGAADFRPGARAYFLGIPLGQWDYSAFTQYCSKLPSFPKVKGIRKSLCRQLWDSCLQEIIVDFSTAEARETPASGTSSVSTPVPLVGPLSVYEGVLPLLFGWPNNPQMEGTCEEESHRTIKTFYGQLHTFFLFIFSPEAHSHKAAFAVPRSHCVL